MIHLGMTVKDEITGFTGIAIRKLNSISGSGEIFVQPKAQNGNFIRGQWFDEERLEEVTSKLECEGGSNE